VAEVEKLTRLRDEAEKGSAEHRELNHRLMKARRRLYEVEWARRERRGATISAAGGEPNAAGTGRAYGPSRG
jgi:hypothetical protein